jgi:hypothetical protein
MKRRYAIVLGVALGVIGSIVGVATVGRTAPPPPTDPPVGPTVPKDTGAGEQLVAVVAGAYSSKGEAVAANDQITFGDLQGYYVAPIEQFGGLGAQVGMERGYVLVSVFRSEEGAQEFLRMAADFGQPATLLAERVTSYGGEYAGLGQEPDPSGTGPLTRPIPASLGLEDADT